MTSEELDTIHDTQKIYDKVRNMRGYFVKLPFKRQDGSVETLVVLNPNIQDEIVPIEETLADVMEENSKLGKAIQAEQEKVRVLKEALEGIANYQSTEVFAGKVLEIDTDPEFLKRLARYALTKVSEVKE